MKQTTFQHPELRDANDNIIQAGTYGKESPLVNGDNTGVLDYINNNLEALYDNINGSRIYVASKAALPATGDLSAMYIAEDTGKWYLWDGTKYIETDNARKIADEAIAARDAAKASQTAAETSEQNAKTSETNADASKQAAATSAGAAKTSEQNADTQANTAKAWATSTTSPDGAADTASTTGKTQSAKSWAMYSKDRATAAATSASAAAGSAWAAKTSENNAANSKTAAATSATNAANSAKAAANSATAAANSAREQQADWNVTDTTSKAFIKNKPDVLLKSGGTVTGTITASKFSGPLTGDVTGTADKAVADSNGNNIANTYVTKSGLASSVTTDTGKVATLTATDSTLTNLTVTGETTVPTANAGNSSKAIANTEFVAKSLAALVNSAPDQLNTLNELAKALGNDANFSATITAELAKKLNSTEAESTYATKTEAGVPYQIKRNTPYKVGDVLTSPSLPPGCVIVVTQAGTTGSTEPDLESIKSNIGGVIQDGTVMFYVNDTLSKHSVGDIVYKPLSKITEHEYLLPLDGQTIDGMTYKRLVDYLGTKVLPNLNGRYLRADSIPGTMIDAGLPNIVAGKITTQDWGNIETQLTGAWVETSHTPKVASVDGGRSADEFMFTFDASHSNSIYGNSATVTPLTYTVRAYICYA